MEAATSISPSPPPSADEGPSTSSSSTSSGGPSRFPEVYSEEERDMESPELIQQQSSMSYRVRPVPRRIPSSLGLEEPPADDTLSCVIVILTFWFFGNSFPLLS